MNKKTIKTDDLNNGKDNIPNATPFVLNFTEIRQSQKALLESEEKFRAIFEQNPIGIIMVRGF